MVRLSLVLVLAGIVGVLIRMSGLKPWHAVISALLGFYLRDSSLAPGIDRAVRAIADVISYLHP